VPPYSYIPLNNAKRIVFVAPLDWGLGHATRCIPLVKRLLESGCEVVIGASGDQAQLLKKEFPKVPQVPLKPYNIRLGKKRSTTIVKILFQIPKILGAIKTENKWLKKFLANNKIDIVISDNRYGLHHPFTPCIFITHQLYIKPPLEKFIGLWLQKIQYKYIQKFNECWVADIENEEGSLAGALSHPIHLPSIATRYIGILSRIQTLQVSPVLPLLIILSGPEPQRTLLEKIILAQLKTFPQSCVMVRGLPTQTEQLFTRNSLLQVHNHLPASTLQSFIAQAAVIVSRPGYSTVMDILPLGKKCIFIPTPGQTEQEYLAAYLSSKNWCVSTTQQAFNLTDMLSKADGLQMPNLSYLRNQEGLQAAINACLLMQ
jgi:uncharacterized protein (TIGR00661 family)